MIIFFVKNSFEIEKELVLKLIDGDEAAFSELYTLYKTRLMYFALQFVKSQEIAEDIFQDAFTSVWLNRQFINPNLSFNSYVYTTVKNRILNLLANIDREQELKKAILATSIDGVNGTEEILLGSELENIIEKAIAKLTPQQKVVFEMSRKGLKSRKEIAAKLGISVNTVQQHISDSLKIIRKFLVKHNTTYLMIFFTLLVN